MSAEEITYTDLSARERDTAMLGLGGMLKTRDIFDLLIAVLVFVDGVDAVFQAIRDDKSLDEGDGGNKRKDAFILHGEC